ncbi:MAG: hypothetical protein JNL74_22420 [Fibrobacteres bacterium]|nr:hypothetical protein [Fibrobacterota bacterium]
MKSIIIKSAFALLFTAALASAKSKPFNGFTVFHLGEPAASESYTGKIPHGESAVTCLTEADNSFVFAGTRVVKGNTPWIVCYDQNKKSVPPSYVWPLSGSVKGEMAITALVTAADGYIYGSTSRQNVLDYALVKEIKASAYAGGHLFRFKPEPSNMKIEDLGVQFQGEGITALAIDSKRAVIYGITTPGLVFFSYSTADKKTNKAGDLGGLTILRNRYIGRAPTALVVDDSGFVYGYASKGKLFKYTPSTNQITTLATAVTPTEIGGQDYDAVTAFVKSQTGRIFGGTFLDGKIFEFFPAKGSIKPLGITSRTGNIRSLVEKDGIIYGFTGSEKASSTLFAFNTKTGEHKAFPEFKAYFKETTNKWVPFQMAPMIKLKNGSFMTGENSDNGHLYLYEPESIEWAEN